MRGNYYGDYYAQLHRIEEIMSGFFFERSVDEVSVWLQQKEFDSDVIEAFKREYPIHSLTKNLKKTM